MSNLDYKIRGEREGFSGWICQRKGGGEHCSVADWENRESKVLVSLRKRALPAVREEGLEVTMASVLKRAVAYWTLAQVIVFCGAEDPVHIQLNLDGKEIITDDNDLPNEKYDALANIPTLVKMWYNSQTPDKPVYNDDTKKNDVEKAGLKKLYIRGKFRVINAENYDQRAFQWDNESKGAKELAEFVLKIFKPGAVVVVIFPDDLQTLTGFKFQKEFEEVVHRNNEDISVGRGVINVYLGLGDQNQKGLEEKINEQTNTDLKDHDKDEKYYSIFAKYGLNKFSFRTVFGHWRSGLKPVNIYQVEMQEADSVAVKLISVCTSINKKLTVGSQTEQNLAEILLKLLRVNDVETHPMQRVRVELPKTCGTASEREVFTDQLVNELVNKHIKAFGKEPQVHMQFYTNKGEKGNRENSEGDIKQIKEAHQHDIFVEIENDGTITPDNSEWSQSVSSAKELFIHIHCHGEKTNQGFTICGKDSASLAKILFDFVKTPLANSVQKTVMIKFHVCEAGDEFGQKSVKLILKEFDQFVTKQKIGIQLESLSYKYETSQVGKHTQVTVPCVAWYDPQTWANVHEKEVFGKFTVRTVKDEYKSFILLPLTEYKLVYPKQNQP